MVKPMQSNMRELLYNTSVCPRLKFQDVKEEHDAVFSQKQCLQEIEELTSVSVGILRVIKNESQSVDSLQKAFSTGNESQYCKFLAFLRPGCVWNPHSSSLKMPTAVNYHHHVSYFTDVQK